MSIKSIIEAIHSSPTQAVIYLSGGASQTLGWLMSAPGASNTVLEVVVPYSRMSTIQLFGKVPTQFTSRVAAEEMALLAYNRALKLSRPGRIPCLRRGFYWFFGHRTSKTWGSQILGWLMSAPGASNTVLEVVVPYSRMSTIQLFDKVPTQFTSRVAAEEMALLAYNRALKLSRPGSPVLGVGFTGSLATAHPKLGDHRFHLSTRTSERLWVATVTLSKGLRNREEEDTVSSHVLLKAIANACKVSGEFDTGLTESEFIEEVEECFNEDQELEQLICGKICFKVYPFSGEVQNFSSERKIILSGSFNPLHEGHLKLLEVATTIVGDGYPCFELSAVNADKPPLTVSQIKDRIKQFDEVGKTVIISNQPFFYKKAELFPGSAFVIGADTAARLINQKYYGNDYDKMVEILGSCKRTGTIFLVGGRNVDGVFKVLEDFYIPVELKDMFISIPTEEFRVDISSSEIRESGRK